MISKKALIAALKSMDLATVLCPSYRRSANHRGYAVEVALASFVDVSFGQASHSSKRCDKLVNNPRWFRQLYTDLSWASGDVTVYSILQALA